MSVNRIAWRLKKAKALRDYIGRYTAGSKTIMPNEVPVGLNVSWQLEKTGSEEQTCSKHLRVTIQTTSKHVVNSLNSHQAVHKRYRAASHWRNGRSWRRSEVAIESPYISGSISDVWQLTALLHCGFTSALTLTSPSSILCSQNCWRVYPLCAQVLKTFNCHLNHKREFTIITRKTLHDHFWCPIRKFDTLLSIIY